MTKRPVRGRKVKVKGGNVAIYTRKSTIKGLDRQENTLTFQRETCENYFRGKPNFTILPDHYDDGGISGAQRQRPGLDRLEADIRAGKVQAVAVYKLDRLSRSQRDLHNLIGLLEDYNVSLVIVTLDFDTTGPFGKMLLALIAAVAELELDLITERTSDKMYDMRTKGMFTGGRPPLGYDINYEEKKLVINQEEALLVRRIFNLYLEYGSMNMVADTLNEQGLTTKKWKARNGNVSGGGPFTVAYLSHLLKNRTYTGKVLYDGEVYEGQHDTIVDDFTFKMVAEKLLANKAKETRPRRKNEKVLFRDLIYCSHESKMGHTFTKKGPKKYCYYACTKKLRGLPCECSQSRVAAGKLEGDILGEIRGLVHDDAFVAELVGMAQSSHKKECDRLSVEQDELRKERKRLWSKISYNKDKLDRLEDIVEARERIAEIDIRIKEIKEHLDGLGRKGFDKNDFKAALAMFGPAWESLPFIEQRRMVEMLIEKIYYVADEGPDGTLYIDFRESGVQAMTMEVA